MGNEIVIRQAVIEDSEATARLNFDTWETSFRGLVPDEWMNKRNVDQHISQFQKRFAEFGFGGMHIAELDGKVLGFSDGGATRDKSLPFDAELYAIYVLKAHQGKGVGQTLFRAVVNKAAKDGFHSIIAKTFSTSPYRRFYERQGGQIVPGYKEDWEAVGVKIPLVAFCWKDLAGVPDQG